jgi:hypothetical protein
MKNLLIFAFTLLANLTFSQTSSYSEFKWLNQACSDNLHCNTGCSACNVATNSDSYFFATNPVFLGIDICPHPISSGDNALDLQPWTVFVDSNKYALFTFITSVPVNIDSIIVRSSSPFGPNRLLISKSVNASPYYPIQDIESPVGFENTIITNGGFVGLSSFVGFVQIKIQPYGNGGSWHLDSFKIVVSPDISTGILDFNSYNLTPQHPYRYTDVLGRDVSKWDILNRPLGVYIKK